MQDAIERSDLCAIASNCWPVSSTVLARHTAKSVWVLLEVGKRELYRS